VIGANGIDFDDSTDEVTNNYSASWSRGCAFSLVESDNMSVRVLDNDVFGTHTMGSWTIPGSELFAARGGTVTRSSGTVALTVRVR
jgi:hypothetical protein